MNRKIGWLSGMRWLAKAGWLGGRLCGWLQLALQHLNRYLCETSQSITFRLCYSSQYLRFRPF